MDRSFAVLAALAASACANLGTSSRETHLAVDARATFLHVGFGAGPVVFTNASGALLEERRAEPFGAVIGAADVVARDLGTLNRRVDAATSWSDHGARWLVPETARWLGGDPPVEAPDPAQMAAPWRLHPYQYVDQNPVAYWDPDGREPLPVVVDHPRPEGAMRDGIEALRAWPSPSPIARNTAAWLPSFVVEYIESEVPVVASTPQAAPRYTVVGSGTTVEWKPGTTGMITYGRGKTVLSVSAGLDREALARTLMRLVNIEVNRRPRDTFDQYDTQYRAYFVSWPGTRAERHEDISRKLITEHESFRNAYESDNGFAEHVDQYRFPDGNVDNHLPNQGR